MKLWKVTAELETYVLSEEEPDASYFAREEVNSGGGFLFCVAIEVEPGVQVNDFDGICWGDNPEELSPQQFQDQWDEEHPDE